MLMKFIGCWKFYYISPTDGWEDFVYFAEFIVSTINRFVFVAKFLRHLTTTKAYELCLKVYKIQWRSKTELKKGNGMVKTTSQL